jgi:hypothetical protein
MATLDAHPQLTITSHAGNASRMPKRLSAGQHAAKPFAKPRTGTSLLLELLLTRLGSCPAPGRGRQERGQDVAGSVELSPFAVGYQAASQTNINGHIALGRQIRDIGRVWNKFCGRG